MEEITKVDAYNAEVNIYKNEQAELEQIKGRIIKMLEND